MASNFSIGDEVFVHDPQVFFPDCTCIVGPIHSIGYGMATIRADVGRMGGGYCTTLAVPLRQLGHRIGTPISQLSGRPGHPGFDQFWRIAASWGYG